MWCPKRSKNRCSLLNCLSEQLQKAEPFTMFTSEQRTQRSEAHESCPVLLLEASRSKQTKLSAEPSCVKVKLCEALKVKRRPEASRGCREDGANHLMHVRAEWRM